MSQAASSNALARETSPYLLQHAHNPVQWYPWGEVALDRARREDKPILLSVGYSACHWCHVMAHESFEDEETAALMNEHFINIKVDREERPDVDKIYQTAQQLLTRRAGGWPLTMFLTPEDLVPFFGGTYFPPEPRFGMPGFRDLLVRVAEYFRKEREAIRRQNASMAEALRTLERPEGGGGELSRAPLDGAAGELEGIFDAQYGGFGGAPKFPHPSNLEFLLEYHVAGGGNGSGRALEMVRSTLEHMALGGIYDQLGGGFCRYSVDAQWMIPHFEKMLYDNGPLLALYAEMWHLTGNDLFRRVASETADWVLREMRSPEGGFYSSLDADSEGEEGKFYVWTREEIRDLLDEEQYSPFARRFGLDRAANFEGRWHLHAFRSVEEIAAETNNDPGTVQGVIDAARARLLAARTRRVRPGRDDKILTSWNALMIRGLAVAARRLQREDLLEAADEAMSFIHDRLWREDRLIATFKDGRAHLNAYLDDYAFLTEACLQLLECRWSQRWLNFAVELADTILREFQDEKGGFYFTSHFHERLIQRRQDFMDDALPSGNGVAALALTQLGHLLGEERYLESAERTLLAAAGAMQRIPHAHGTLLVALSRHLQPPRQIIVRGTETDLAQWRRRAAPLLDLRSHWFGILAAEQDLPGLLGERRLREGASAIAYLCEGFQCRTPITDPDALAAALKPAKPG